ncbi:hypothetical protein EDB89DRAFT_1912095 [Lactarius sanguifluus]|nr:hypothetical protein EDB89DRAFT_1912095 [Lactarius sanguifluus]
MPIDHDDEAMPTADHEDEAMPVDHDDGTTCGHTEKKQHETQERDARVYEPKGRFAFAVEFRGEVGPNRHGLGAAGSGLDSGPGWVVTTARQLCDSVVMRKNGRMGETCTGKLQLEENQWRGATSWEWVRFGGSTVPKILKGGVRAQGLCYPSSYIVAAKVEQKLCVTIDRHQNFGEVPFTNCVINYYRLTDAQTVVERESSMEKRVKGRQGAKRAQKAPEFRLGRPVKTKNCPNNNTHHLREGGRENKGKNERTNDKHGLRQSD